MVASKLSLKPCRKTQQGFHARKSIAAKRGEVSPPGKMFPRSAARFSRLGKCSCAARRGFPAWENVAAERGKVFPPGKMFLRSAARFSRSGKCSPRAGQGFPVWENVPHERGKVFPLGKVFPTSAARFSHYSHPENFHRLMCSPVLRAYAIPAYMLFSMSTIKSGASELKFRRPVYPT